MVRSEDMYHWARSASQARSAREGEVERAQPPSMYMYKDIPQSSVRRHVTWCNLGDSYEHSNHQICTPVMVFVFLYMCVVV